VSLARACLSLLLTAVLTVASFTPSAAGGASRQRTDERRTTHAAAAHADDPADRTARRAARVRRTAAEASSAEPAQSPHLRILFIGNSHTDRHGGMDWLVGNLAASESPARTIETERLVGSGVTLEYHVHNGALRRIREGDWDIVVLQEYVPGIPTRSVDSFYTNGHILDDAIRASGAKTVLYMTWPERLHAWASLDDIAAAHRRLATELGANVAPVGIAMARALAERPDMTFLDWDGVHTTWQGAYLAAATIYAALFQRSPEGLPYHLGISDDDATFLQRIAWETVSDWQAGSSAVPEAETTLPDTPASSPVVAANDRPTG
jgi:hypothetical protein